MFNKKVDKRSRKAMIAYLKNHFCYSTMNSWNNSTSYANNVKIYKLGLPTELETKAYDIIMQEEFYAEIRSIMNAWAKKYNYAWQAGFNGRSDGYVVLYQGGLRDSGYKSYCPNCGQRNYQPVSETSSKCGVCKEPRVNYFKTPTQIFTYPGKSTDMYEDFEDWDLNTLRDRVDLVQDFDFLCDLILLELISFCENYEVVEEEILVPKKIKVLQPVSAGA